MSLGLFALGQRCTLPPVMPAKATQGAATARTGRRVQRKPPMLPERLVAYILGRYSRQ